MADTPLTPIANLRGRTDENGMLLVKPTGGATGGTSSDFGNAFPTTGTAVGFKRNDGTAMDPVTLEADGSVPVTLVAGGGSGGTSSNFGSAIPSAGTAVGFEDASGDMRPAKLAADRSVNVTVVGGGGGGGAVTVADGADVALGATTDAAVITDATGTISGKLRGLVALLVSIITSGRVKAQTEVQIDADTGGGTQSLSAVLLGLPGSGGAVAGGTATNPIRTDPTGTTTQPVSAVSLPLPTGAATLAAQTTGNASLASIDGKVTAVDTGAVVVASSALPTGAATAGNQTSVIGTKAPGAAAASALLTGAVYTLGGVTLTDGQQAALQVNADGELLTAGGGGGPVTVADGADVALGATTDAAVITDTTGTVSGKLRGLVALLVSIISSGRVKAQTEVQIDADTGGGTQSLSAVLLGLPAPGGAVAGGTATNPIRTDPTGTTAQSVVGNVAHDDADSGNPAKIGVKAATALPAVVAANDRANVIGDVYGRPFMRAGHQGPAGSIFTVEHSPAANTKATASKASAGAGVRNVLTGLTVTLAAGATAPTAVTIHVSVIDGASGGSTYLWRSAMSLPAVAGAQTSIVRGALWIPGTAATAMTVEFSAAGGANTVESVAFEGVTLAE